MVVLSDLAASVVGAVAGYTLPDRNLPLASIALDALGTLRRSRPRSRRHRTLCSCSVFVRPQHMDPARSRNSGLDSLVAAVDDHLEELDSGNTVAEAPCTGLSGRKPLRSALIRRGYKIGGGVRLLWGIASLGSSCSLSAMNLRSRWVFSKSWKRMKGKGFEALPWAASAGNNGKPYCRAAGSEVESRLNLRSSFEQTVPARRKRRAR